MQIIRIIKKFKGILSEHQKLRIFELGVLMIIGGILETLSVSLILPFIDLMIEPDRLMQKPFVIVICSLLGAKSSREFLIIIAICVGLLYLIKNAYLLVEYNIQYRFVSNNCFSMQQRLLSCMLHRPYEYYLGINSGEIIRIVNSDAPTGFSLLMTLLSFFTEMVISSMLVITVFVITPVISVIMSVVLIGMVLLINQFLRPRLKNATRQVQSSGTGQNKWLLQSIHGIKEIKVMRREGFFLDKYGEYGHGYIYATRKRDVLSITPRYILEAVSMCTIFFTIAALIYNGYALNSLIPAVSAIAIAAIRLLPSVNKMSSFLSALSANEPMLDTLIENIDMIQSSESSDSDRKILPVSGSEDVDDHITDKRIHSFDNNLDFKRITYRYPQGDTNVLNDAIVTIHKGESVGIVGSSGAGKTTMVDILLGLLLPQDGSVLVDGMDIHDDMDGWLKQVGYIPQMIFMLDDTVRENVAFGDPEVSDDRVWEALHEASMDEFVRGMSKGLDTEIGERGIRLSGGQRQRIGIARALYANPSILFFDEATSALDNETETAIMESIQHLHGTKTMIIIAHRLSTIEGCDHVYKVQDGSIQKVR